MEVRTYFSELHESTLKYSKKKSFIIESKVSSKVCLNETAKVSRYWAKSFSQFSPRLCPKSLEFLTVYCPRLVWRAGGIAPFVHWALGPKDLPWVKSAVSLKQHVGFENGMKMTPIFTIIFISKMLIQNKPFT